jgi:hypothetical protein
MLLPFSVCGSSQIRFEEIGAKAGLNFQLKNGSQGRFRQVELMVGGVAVFDYDGDGCQDVFFTNGAALPSLRKQAPEFHNRLFRNNCDATFRDVTAKTGVAGEGYSMAVATADYDNDGHSDIFVAGVNRNILYRNRGDGAFEDVTENARMGGIDRKFGKMWAISAGWFDYNRDGHLDLFISNYVLWDPRTEPRCGTTETPLYCHPDNYRGLPNQLFRNNGDGTFSDVTYESGIGEHIGKGMGVAFADFNRDGFVDVFVANDSVRSFLFENKGNGKFEELGLEYGVGLREDGAAIAGMGVDTRDFDNDGLPDIFLTGMINDTFLLFRNLGKGLPFADHSVLGGTTVATRQLTGWSTGMYDFDNDGWKDIFCATSHFPNLGRYLTTDSRLANVVLRNEEGSKFRDVSKSAGEGFQKIDFHHGAAFGDIDRDGRVDAVVSVLNGPPRLFRNISEPHQRWLAFDLRGTRSNTDGLGAEVTLTLPNSDTLHNFATTSVGYASSSERIVRFGLREFETVKQVLIRWPSGATQTLTGVRAGQVVKVEEPGQQ